MVVFYSPAKLHKCSCNSVAKLMTNCNSSGAQDGDQPEVKLGTVWKVFPLMCKPWDKDAQVATSLEGCTKRSVRSRGRSPRLNMPVRLPVRQYLVII